ncbi:plastocyanin/azurin family copper-binding protein [Kaistella jeonii]|uniref:plastocyanin/azurin family copper-binding protein n=1 Tax=Kaistella jeonii TaxID=266749 RepID=UPI0008EFA1EF|nr:plastocyanin/azurin family copper-binding protein [Kaistella jeonii]SFC25579.1 Plastocyanin [Kaistella jeonii]VEI95658.1 Amicyanin precursor [Kaistella jeonii]
MLKYVYKIKFTALALGFLLIVSACNSGSKDTMPAINNNSAAPTNDPVSKIDSIASLPKVDSATTSKTVVTENANLKTETHVVTIENMKFNPAIITVNKGDKVTFINKDIVAHNATETKKLWASPLLQNGQSWTFAPDKTSDYYCSVHLVMKGKIIVK